MGQQTEPRAQKYLFDTEFLADEPEPNPVADEADEEQAPPEPTYGEADLAASRADGFAEGHDAGLAEGQAETERLAARAAGVISERLSEIADTVRSHHDSVALDAVAVASAVIAKIAPEIIDRGALSAIEAAISGCLPDLTDEPRIVIRVGEKMMDTVQARIEPIVKASGFSGDVVVIADPALEFSDCTVEWADGGIRHDPSRVWREVEEILRTHLGATDPVAPPSDEVTELTQPETTDASGGPEPGVNHG